MALGFFCYSLKMQYPRLGCVCTSLIIFACASPNYTGSNWAHSSQSIERIQNLEEHLLRSRQALQHQIDQGDTTSKGKALLEIQTLEAWIEQEKSRGQSETQGLQKDYQERQKDWQLKNNRWQGAPP